MLELSCEGSVNTARAFGRHYGGDVFNVAVAAARLGSSVSFVTRLGQDVFAAGLQEMLQKEGIQPVPAKPGRGGTSLYFVSSDAANGRNYVYYRDNSAVRQLGPNDITQSVLKGAKIVYASGITLAISDSARQATFKAFEMARKMGITTAFDPNYRSELWPSEERAVDALNNIVPLVDVLLPSFPRDTVSLINFQRPEQVLEYFLFKGVKLVVVKAGPQGCYLGYKREVQHLTAPPIKAIDSTGVGDAFNAGFLHGLANEESLVQCARLGITTATLKVLNRGSAMVMPTREAVYSRV